MVHTKKVCERKNTHYNSKILLILITREIFEIGPSAITRSRRKENTKNYGKLKWKTTLSNRTAATAKPAAASAATITKN